MPSLVVIGSGPGIGLATATLFAEKKFNKIVLLSRSSTRLQEDRSNVLRSLASRGKTDVEVTTYSVDISDSKGFQSILNQAASALPDLTCVLFNAAKVAPSDLLTYGEEQMLEDFKTTNIAMMIAARWAVPILKEVKEEDKPSFLVTSSLLWKEPFVPFFSLSAVKTSQRNLVQSWRSTFPDIHFCLLNVAGQVSPESKDFSPMIISEKYWKLYSQEKKNWTLDLDVLPSS